MPEKTLLPKGALIIGFLIMSGLIVVKAGWTPTGLSWLRAYFQKENQNTTIVATGNVEVREIDLGFTRSGRIEQVFAEEGQQIQQGEKLATIEKTEITNTVIKNRAILEEAAARLEDLQSGARQQEIDAPISGVILKKYRNRRNCVSRFSSLYYRRTGESLLKSESNKTNTLDDCRTMQ
jgi:multidrug efflux pump subunit AcrA (membrane-fusion protein)